MPADNWRIYVQPLVDRGKMGGGSRGSPETPVFHCTGGGPAWPHPLEAMSWFASAALRGMGRSLDPVERRDRGPGGCLRACPPRDLGTWLPGFLFFFFGHSWLGCFGRFRMRNERYHTGQPRRPDKAESWSSSKSLYPSRASIFSRQFLSERSKMLFGYISGLTALSFGREAGRQAGRRP